MYGFLIGFSTICAALIAEKLIKIKKINISNEEFWNLTLIIFFLSVLGGRFYHILDKWDFYSLNLVSTLYIWNGGLGIFGSVYLNLAFLYFYSKKYKKNMLVYTDLLCLFTPAIIIAGRLGNYFNKEIVQGFYEIFFMLLIYILFFLNSKKIKIGNGEVTYSFFIVYGLTRIIIEPFRNKSDSFIILNINLTYLFSLFLIFIGFGIIYLKQKKDLSFKF